MTQEEAMARLRAIRRYADDAQFTPEAKGALDWAIQRLENLKDVVRVVDDVRFDGVLVKRDGSISVLGEVTKSHVEELP